MADKALIDKIATCAGEQITGLIYDHGQEIIEAIDQVRAQSDDEKTDFRLPSSVRIVRENERVLVSTAISWSVKTRADADQVVINITPDMFDS